MELTTLTDDELTDHLNAVLNEQERRAALANIPAQISALAALYVAGGGIRTDLNAAVNTPV